MTAAPNIEALIRQAANDPQRAQRLVDARRAEQSLRAYAALVWPVVEPGRPLSWGRHMDAIADHLEACSRGELKRLVINVPPGCSKALDVDEPILTIWGWRRHGDLRPGDFVYGPDGRPRRVEAVSERRREPAYRVRWSDGSEVVAGQGHLWTVLRDASDRRGRRVRVPVTVETPALKSGARGDAVDLAPPLVMGHQELPIEPYTLGAWLGGGAATGGTIYVSERDRAALHRNLGGECRLQKPATETTQAFYRIRVPELQVRLRLAGLLGAKRVPEQYLQADESQRWALLQGLMDTDGHCARNGRPCFSNTNEAIARAAQRLAWSLGLKATCRRHASHLNGRRYRDSFRVSFTAREGDRIFRLDRKQRRVRPGRSDRSFRRYLVDVEPVGDREVSCIQVEGKIYLAGHGLVPTHNSLLTNILWPTWEWGPRDHPFLRYLSFAYAQALTIRDNLKARRLILSPLYQSLWAHRFQLVADQNAKVRYDTDQSGFRMASSIGGVGTGERADRLVLDDPNSVQESESATKLDTAVRFFSETLPSRTTDIRTAVIVVIQQRTAVNDVTGHILQSDLGYEWLCYDAETEVLTAHGWVPFPDLEPNVDVVGVDPMTLTARIEAPTAYLRRHYEGPMVRWSSMTADLAVTPDHRMIYADSNDGPGVWRVRQAATLPADFYLPQALAGWEGSDRAVELGGRLWDPIIFAAFMGWYLAEGSAYPAGAHTTIPQNVGPKAEAIREVLRGSPFSHRYHVRADGRRAVIAIGSKALATALRPLGTSWTKRAPRVLLDLSPKALKVFLEAFTDGDGHRAGREGDRPVLSSRSRGLIDDLQEAAVKCGWASSAVTRGQQHFLTLRRSKKPGRPIKAWAKLGRSHRSVENYKGEVFCLSVPSTALVVRRHGRVAISGNCLPMEYERKNPCYTALPRPGVKPKRVRLVQLEEETVPRWMPAGRKIVEPTRWVREPRLLYAQDWRTQEGDLLDPDRFPRENVEQELKKPLRSRGGETAVAGQLQQRPQARIGTHFRREDFRFCDARDLPRSLARPARGYDLAGTEDPSASWSAGVKMAIDPADEDRVYVLHVDRIQKEADDVVAWMQGLAAEDGAACAIDFPQDPAQAGKWQKRFLVGKLSGFTVYSSTEGGKTRESKVQRAGPFASQVKAHNVTLVRGDWTQAFIAEAVTFPAQSDQIDAASRAYARALQQARVAPPSGLPNILGQ